MGDLEAVAVIDDDAWRRRGLAAGIRELGGILSVGAAVDPRDAITVPAVLAAGTLLLVGPASAVTMDRWSVLEVAQEAGQAAPHDDRRVVLLASEMNPVVLLRAAEVGVQAVFPLEEIDDLSALERALLTPPTERHPAISVDRRALRVLGLSLASRPQAFLAELVEAGFRLDAPTLIPGLSRREGITHRHRLCSVLGSTAGGFRVNRQGGGATTSTWRELALVASLALGHPAPSGGPCAPPGEDFGA